jgi:hypothetical protein
MNQLHPTREAWLEAATSELSMHFLQQGHPLPQLVKVSCAFTSGGTRKRNGASAIGECWDASRSAQGAVEIMISPVEDDPVKVLATLCHELCHASAGVKSGHRGVFAKLARSLHLEGPLTATRGSQHFNTVFAPPIIKTLGTYPHAALDTSTRTKQTTRMLRCRCAQCGYTVRVTQAWLRLGAPVCPNTVDDAARNQTFSHGHMVVG